MVHWFITYKLLGVLGARITAHLNIYFIPHPYRIYIPTNYGIEPKHCKEVPNAMSLR
jgi:hypothetical protein